MSHPNILLITTDTQRCDTLNCMGYDFAISPHTDRLAAEGIMFTQGHTSSPVCGPTRSSLLTGLHTPVHGAIENGVSPRPNLITFSDRLKEAGYTNIMSGKTHFGPLPDSFDIDFSTSGGKSGGTGDIYSQHLIEHGYTRCDGHPNPIPEDLFFDAFVTTKTIEGIEQARSQSDGPFFAFCSMVSPHGPLDPPGKWADLYTDDMLPPLPNNPDFDYEPAHARRLLDFVDKKKATPEKIRQVQKLYYGLSSYCDHQVGRLMTYLDEKGLRENTLIIFLSDNGASAEIMVRADGHDPAAEAGSAATYLCLGPGWSTTCNTPFRRHKTWVHEGGCATPFIVHWPGGIPARSALRRTPAHVIDVAPTLLDLAGLTPQRRVPSPGRSLKGTFPSDGNPLHEELWWLHEGHRALRQGDWKLVAAKGDQWELFNLSEDRTETRDLAGSHPEQVGAMEKRWNNLAESFQETLKDNR